MRKNVDAFDRFIGHIVGNFPGWTDPLMRFFTLIGQPPFTVGIGALAPAYGFINDSPYYVSAGIVVLGTLAVSSFLKLFMHRKRPPSAYVNKMMFKTFSFPSGHAAGAVVSYGFVTLVLLSLWPQYETAIWTAFIALSAGIGISRVYLRAHYASDVVGGWIIGTVGLLVLLQLPY